MRTRGGNATNNDSHLVDPCRGGFVLTFAIIPYTYIIHVHTAAETAAFLRDATRNPLYSRAGSLPIFGELARRSDNLMLRYNRLVDINHDPNSTSRTGGYQRE